MPKSSKTLDISTIKKVASLIAGNYRTSFKWVGIEFEDLREYAFWDDVHDIDWLSSTKTGKLFIKKYEEERELTTLFVIDTGENMLFGSGEKRKKDTLEEIFLTLAFSWLKWGDAMGSIHFSDTILRQIPPKKSRANFSLMIDMFEETKKRHAELVSASKDRRDPEINSGWLRNAITSWTKQSNIEIAIDELYKRRTKNHLIFILTDSLTPPNEKKLRALAHGNDLVWFHIFDSYENTLKLDSPIHLTDKKSHILAMPDEKKRIEYEKFRTEKIKNFEKNIRAVGWDYLRFDETDNTFKKLFQFFKKRQARV